MSDDLTIRIWARVSKRLEDLRLEARRESIQQEDAMTREEKILFKAVEAMCMSFKDVIDESVEDVLNSPTQDIYTPPV